MRLCRLGDVKKIRLPGRKANEFEEWVGGILLILFEMFVNVIKYFV